MNVNIPNIILQVELERRVQQSCVSNVTNKALFFIYLTRREIRAILFHSLNFKSHIHLRLICVMM